MEYGSRKVFQDFNLKPFLFYVIFGVEGEILVSRSKHRSDGIPLGLDLRKISRPKDSRYIDGFFDEYLGKLLEEKDESFQKRVRESASIHVLQGHVENDRDLLYLRDVVRLIQCALEGGAAGVLDILSLKWMDRRDWENEYFLESVDNLLKHVLIIRSDETDGIWLHTRGMVKIGRPDVSVKMVPEGETANAVRLVNRIVGFQILGGVLDCKSDIRMPRIPDGIRFRYIEDPDNVDFNNVYFEADWPL
jgi:hypothetical protein